MQKLWKLRIANLTKLALIIMTSFSLNVYGKTPERSAYFGDTHIHTLYSFDAFLGNVRTSPNDAYLYGKGHPIKHPSGISIRLSGPPLDFLMVSDHAKYLGILAAQIDPQAPYYGHPGASGLIPKSGENYWGTFMSQIKKWQILEDEKAEFMGPEVWKYAWQKIIDAAEQHNDPGNFTTFIGYEYTPTPGSRHLHRNVMFKGSEVPARPFSSGDSMNPEDLWNWLDALRADGIDAIAIPHNMNQSDGLAFQTKTFSGETITRAYAEQRMRNEPIAEISQQKGTSETHPLLSPNDEWANFQIVQYYLNRITNSEPISVFKGGYYRDALLTGLEMQEAQGFNPYKMGAIGASDTHLSAAPFEENEYFTSRVNTPISRGSAYPDYKQPNKSWDNFNTPRGATHGTGGLAGVWSEENTRASLFNSMRRRETFATSGPRIRVRFFAGNDLPENIAESEDPVAIGYSKGVPMGGVLNGLSEAPQRFFIWASRDPKGGWLQRAQIIKGWVEGGESKEAVFDVVCSDGIKPDPNSHRCADNGATVNLADCSTTRDKGAVSLKATWTDPHFKSNQQTFYYARVLENPSCRWSTWDAIRLGIKPNPDLPMTHQERAWSSPIWYQP